MDFAAQRQIVLEWWSRTRATRALFAPEDREGYDFVGSPEWPKEVNSYSLYAVYCRQVNSPVSMRRFNSILSVDLKLPRTRDIPLDVRDTRGRLQETKRVRFWLLPD
jgi:hypothetical protein